jgi:DNA-binding CsgD family transcriptional regulator
VLLRQSIARSAATLAEKAEREALRERYERLSNREREVVALVVTGLMNKQVDNEVGISEITVKAPGKVMRKMKAGSLVDLVHMAARLCLGSAAHGRDSAPVGSRSGKARLDGGIAARATLLAERSMKSARVDRSFAPWNRGRLVGRRPMLMTSVLWGTDLVIV